MSSDEQDHEYALDYHSNKDKQVISSMNNYNKHEDQHIIKLNSYKIVKHHTTMTNESMSGTMAPLDVGIIIVHGTIN